MIRQLCLLRSCQLGSLETAVAGAGAITIVMALRRRGSLLFAIQSHRLSLLMEVSRPDCASSLSLRPALAECLCCCCAALSAVTGSEVGSQGLGGGPCWQLGGWQAEQLLVLVSRHPLRLALEPSLSRHGGRGCVSIEKRGRAVFFGRKHRWAQVSTDGSRHPAWTTRTCLRQLGRSCSWTYVAPRLSPQRPRRRRSSCRDTRSSSHTLPSTYVALLLAVRAFEACALTPYTWLSRLGFGSTDWRLARQGRLLLIRTKASRRASTTDTISVERVAI